MATSVLERSPAVTQSAPVTHHRTTRVDGVNIFYREAGPAQAPVVLLLHGLVKRYAMYVMDYGAPVGWRLALKHPERVT